MNWRVYYLYSEKINKHYLGKTNNLKRRFKEYNNSEEKYTKVGVPWKLLGYIDCVDSKEAYSIENKLKKSKNKKYIQWYIKQYGIIII